MKFCKVSKDQFEKDCEACFHYKDTAIYDEIKHPKRATIQSAGYDIFTPVAFMLQPDEAITIPTGITIELERGTFLMLVPRSGLGFKYQLGLANTVGIIDADYYGNSDNEGHILVKLVNRGIRPVHIKAGDAICQGIIMEYMKCDNDITLFTRRGGIGSTDKQEVTV